MLRFIDISNWQGGIELPSVLDSIDGVVCKATEGTGYIDPYCEGFVSDARSAGKLWGFYHFAGDGSATSEARFFMDNCEGYFGHGIPVLDWEGNQSVAWVNEFVRAIHSEKGVWPIIYGNPWRFNQGGVEENCARWVASYPSVVSPTFEQAEQWDAPYADGNVAAWQFCSDGHVGGYGGNLDCDLFYGDAAAWQAYAGSSSPAPSPAPTPSGEHLGDVHIRYALHVLGGEWWPEVEDFDDYAGAPFTKHDMLLMYVDKGSIRYRTHGTDGYWRDWVTGADYRDAVHGMAGDWRVPIDGVQCEYLTPDGYVYQYAYYKSQTTQREGWLEELKDLSDGCGSDYAGIFGEPLDRFMIRIGE